MENSTEFSRVENCGKILEYSAMLHVRKLWKIADFSWIFRIVENCGKFRNATRSKIVENCGFFVDYCGLWKIVENSCGIPTACVTRDICWFAKPRKERKLLMSQGLGNSLIALILFGSGWNHWLPPIIDYETGKLHFLPTLIFLLDKVMPWLLHLSSTSSMRLKSVALSGAWIRISSTSLMTPFIPNNASWDREHHSSELQLSPIGARS